jgi:CRISPR/Cas system-associated exonuclease Cas4 (RecB family)
MHPVHPIAKKLVADIDEGYANESRGEARCYIGASMAGTDCIAQMSLSLRGFPDVAPDPQLKRIFFAGHRIEDWVVFDLKKRADLRVYEKDDMTGRQHRREWLNGHVSCHSDGLVDFEDGSGQAILEIKSMNDANFKKFQTTGVKSSHRRYYRQMQMMMAMFRIERSLFVAYNKNNSQYHAEIVSFDQEEWDTMYVKIQAALDGQAVRVSAAPEDWRCKSCFKRESCWNIPDVSPACQFCEHSFANKNGGWTCKLTGREALDACDKYEMFRPTQKA